LSATQKFFALHRGMAVSLFSEKYIV